MSLASSPTEQVQYHIYKRMLKYAKPYWPVFLVTFIGFCLYAFTQFAWAELMKWLVEAIQAGDYSKRVHLALTIVGIFVIRGLGSFIGSYGMSYISRQVVWQIRGEVFSKILYLPYAHYRKSPVGTTLSWITYHTEQLSGATTDALKVLVQEGLTATALLIYLFYVNWRLSLLFLILTPLVGLLVAYVSKRLKLISVRIQNSIGDVAQITTEMIKGYQIVKSYSGEDFEKKRFSQVNTYNLRQSLKLAITNGLATPVVQLIVGCQLALLVGLALSPSFSGDIGAGSFMAYITAAALLMKPIKSLTSVNDLLMRGVAAAEDIFKLLDAPNESQQQLSQSHACAKRSSTDQELKGQQPNKIASIQGDIQFQDITFTYDDNLPPVLDKFNLTIKQGEMVALVGKTGSGKTTLTDLLLGFYQAQQGQIWLDKQVIEHHGLEILRQSIALVPQFSELFQGSVKDNIAYGELQGASEADIIQAAKLAHAHEFIQSFPAGYHEILGEKGRQISGGQRQRLAIARAILKQAPIMVLDEATSALDNQSEQLIKDSLKSLHGQVTLIVIAHRLSTIEEADRIIVLEAGQILETGSHEQLLAAQGAYSKLYSGG